jgi:hypothetical protein
MTRIAISATALLVPGVAAAHPDHASEGSFGLVHYLTDPFHVGLTVAAVLLFFAVRRTVLRRQAARQKVR